MYWTNCGTKLREGAKFYTSCGKPVKSREQYSVPGESTTNAGMPVVKVEGLAKEGLNQVIAALRDSDITASGDDALTLSQVEAILACNNLTLELLSAKPGETLIAIG